MSEGTTILLQNKLIIGLTGNIATGKSAVMRLAAEHGAFPIDADQVVHEIMETDTTMQAGIAVAFGSEVRREDGRIDRRALGQIVFNDPQALYDLETIVHPTVRHEIVRRIQETDKSIIFIEAIKLFEGGLAEGCHQVWVTRCDKQRQLDRLRICRGMETGEAAVRIKAQPPQEEKVAQADTVIDTNGTMRDTEAQFEWAWRRLPDPTSLDDKTIVLPPKPTPLVDQKETAAQETPVQEKSEPTAATPSKITKPTDLPNDLEVRRAKPSDIAGLLLLIQKATDGKQKMKRAELLMSLSERGYFIGQVGTEISAVMGSSIDSQVARVDEIHIYPPEMIQVTGAAVLAEIERSAFNHMCQIIFVFIPENIPDPLHQLFLEAGYHAEAEEKLANNWQLALKESRPKDSSYLVKILMDTRANS